MRKIALAAKSANEPKTAWCNRAILSGLRKWEFPVEIADPDAEGKLCMTCSVPAADCTESDSHKRLGRWV